MKGKISLLLLSLAFTLLLGHFAPVAACSLSAETPDFCETVGASDAIFVGRVAGGKKRKIIDEDGVKKVWYVGEVYFEIRQAFVGAKKGARVTIRSGDWNDPCGMWFKADETYLIYADADGKKGLFTVSGRRSKPVSAASDDLEALKNLPKKGSGSTVAGTITLNGQSSLVSREPRPMTDLTVEIRRLGGKKLLFEALTDANGIYEIKNLPAGKYKITPQLSNQIEPQEDEIEVKDRGCASRDFLIKNKTKISGRVHDAQGRIVKDIWVELIPADLAEKPKPFTFREKDLTDEFGKFTLENIPPGRYTMSVNYTTSPDEYKRPFPTTFYPNAPEKSQASVFDIRLGSDDIENIDFRLGPRLLINELKGVVIWSDGTPAFDTHVGLRDAEDDLFTDDMRTDKLGNFTLKGIKGRKYFISAENYSSGSDAPSSYVSSDKFVLDENVRFFRLVLEKQTKAKDFPGEIPPEKFEQIVDMLQD